MRLDFAPLARSTVGFDRLFDLMEHAGSTEPEGYPPYDIAKTGPDAFRITLAVAGFEESDLSITSQPNQLVVAGRRSQGERGAGDYLHQGIPARPFQRQFSLADWVTVTGASLRNGLLTIELKREVPEAAKPRRIDIGGEAQKTLRQAA